MTVIAFTGPVEDEAGTISEEATSRDGSLFYIACHIAELRGEIRAEREAREALAARVVKLEWEVKNLDLVCGDLAIQVNAPEEPAPPPSPAPTDDLRDRLQIQTNLRLAAEAECDAMRADLADMEQRKNAAYEERNKVVAALARLFPSGIARTAIEGWHEEWHGCVYIDLPTGQVSWHYHDSQAHLFDGLPPYTGAWDGHSTEEKYQRLASLRLERDALRARLDALEPLVAAVGRVCAITPRAHAAVSWEEGCAIINAVQDHLCDFIDERARRAEEQ